MRTDRVRVFEPDPAAPSGAVPIFGEALDKLGRRVSRNIALSVVMILLGAGLFFLDAGLALPMVCLFGCYLAFWIYCRTTSVPPTCLKRRPFQLVYPEDLVVAGKKVGIQLLDGRWLHLRLPLAWRLQLAGQGRIWLLGDGDRVFALLPGSLMLQRGRVVATPPPGALPPAPVSRETTPPADDVVLGAHRRFLSRTLWIASAALGFFGLLAVWLRSDRTIAVTAIAAVLVLFALLLMKAAADSGRPLTAGNWTELRLVPDGPMRISGRGLARLSGWTMLADGREVGVLIAKADPSLAANIAVTGQLWVVGMPKGRLAVVGVPGYPVTGQARFLAQ